MSNSGNSVPRFSTFGVINDTPSTSATPNTSGASLPGSQLNINKLQAYTNKRVPVRMTQPGYEMYFFSRFDKGGIGDPNDIYSASHLFVNNYDNLLTLSKCKPTFKLYSQTANPNGPYNRNDTPVINSMVIHQAIDESRGTIGAVEIIQPDGVEYFKPTLGVSANVLAKNYPDMDYHDPNNLTDGPIRIGVMDTVLIKMSNTIGYGTNAGGTTVGSGYGTSGQNTLVGSTYTKETVFRGVIGAINRKKSPTGGSIITLQLYDFSEFLRQINALPLGAFSTIFFGLTGRSYTNNLLRYANNLYSGDSKFLGIDSTYQSQFANEFINSFLQAAQKLPQASNINAAITGNEGDVRANPNHQMLISPFFWLEYTKVQDKIPRGIPDNQIGSLFAGDPFSVIGTLISQSAQSLVDLTKQVVSMLGAAINGHFAGYLTPEDTESVQTYTAFGNGKLPTDITKFLNTLGIHASSANVTEIAWILSDLYLQKGIVSFEHQQVWNSIYQTAARSLREVYFDFSPKLRPQNIAGQHDAVYPFDTANWSETLQYQLDDIHPNIGILKYRLSPCFIPYLDADAKNNVVNNTCSNFRHFDIKDDDIIESNTSEDEQGVFTAVFGFGADLGDTTLDLVKKLLDGQNRGLLTYAHTLDTRIESRLGYRFMTDHDEKIQIPVLMYLTSYALLHKSQANMFKQNLEVLGNPLIQPGSIVRILSQGADYYCTQVQHKWSLSEGYKTELNLEYGHTTGRFPTVVSGFGAATEIENIQASAACTMRSKQLDNAGLTPYMNTKIGGVSQGCLVSALWEFMTCSASTDAQLQMATRSYESSHVVRATGDWITLSDKAAAMTQITTIPYSASLDNFPSGSSSQSGADVTQPISVLTSIINSSIATNNLAQYNVTVNTVLNIIAQESAGTNNIISAPSPTTGQRGYGLFQLTGQNISNDDACYNLQKASDLACSLLANAMQANNVTPNNASGTLWLNAIASYNSGASSPGNSSGGSYTSDVFGSQQVALINEGSQLPSNAKAGTIISGLQCQTQTADLKSWPYDVYGPIGMQLTSANSAGFTGNDSPTNHYPYKTALLHFDTGMPLSIKYIGYLLNKYSTNSYSPTLTAGTAPGAGVEPVNQQNTLEKTIAAWFTDEGSSPVNSGLLSDTINKVKTLYNSCTTCLMTPPTSLSASSHTELAAGSTNRQQVADALFYDLNQFPNAKSDILDPTKTTDDLISMLYYLAITTGQYIGILAVNTDHHNDNGSQYGAHTTGNAVDCWPLKNATALNYKDYTDLTSFFQSVLNGPNLLAIGLGGSPPEGCQTAQNYAACGGLGSGKVFTDDDSPHIHIGVS